MMQLVIGKGNAAWCAAQPPRDAGARLAMLEAAPMDQSGADSRFAGGVLRFAFESVEDFTPPYEAYAVTCGGLRIEPASGQVVDVNQYPIPGLYTVGEMVGGIFYFNYPADTGLVSGCVPGRIAAAAAKGQTESLPA